MLDTSEVTVKQLERRNLVRSEAPERARWRTQIENDEAEERKCRRTPSHRKSSRLFECRRPSKIGRSTYEPILLPEDFETREEAKRWPIAEKIE